jgi:hypothetical protein
MKALLPWLKIWLIVAATFALTAALYATPRALEVEWSWDFENLLYERLLYYAPTIGIIALYLTKFKGRVIDSTPEPATEAVAQELIASRYIVERDKGRLNVRLNRSVGVVISARPIDRQCQLRYGLKTMPRGSAWLAILTLIVPAIAVFVAVYYLSKVVRFGVGSMDEITHRASNRPEGNGKSINEMITEGLSEARRISLEAYEASKSNYEDLILLSLLSGALAAAVVIFSTAYLGDAEEFNIDGDVVLYAGATAFLVPTVLSIFTVRRKLKPRLDDLRRWNGRLSYAAGCEACPPADGMAPDSQFELLAEASKEIPVWLEIRRKSRLAREPWGSTLMMYAILYGSILLPLGAALGAIQGSVTGLMVFFAGFLMIATAVAIYRASARRRAAEAKALGDSWRRRSEEMTIMMENLLAGEN